MSWDPRTWSIPNPFAGKSVATLEEEKRKAMEEFDAKIAKAREAETGSPAVGTAPSVGGRRRKTRRSKRSRSGRKSNRL